MNTHKQKESRQPPPKNKDDGKKREGADTSASHGQHSRDNKEGNQQQERHEHQKGNRSSGSQKEGNDQRAEQNQEPVEEKSNKIKGNKNESENSGGSGEPEINMPIQDPAKTEKKIPNM